MQDSPKNIHEFPGLHCRYTPRKDGYATIPQPV